MNRISREKLEGLCDHLNKLAGHEGKELWTKDEQGNNRATVGMYYISGAYGGVELDRIIRPGGATQCPLGLGHRPKRELWEQMRAYIAGIEEERARHQSTTI